MTLVSSHYRSSSDERQASLVLYSYASIQAVYDADVKPRGSGKTGEYAHFSI